jgi:hypothetical protein
MGIMKKGGVVLSIMASKKYSYRVILNKQYGMEKPRKVIIRTVSSEEEAKSEASLILLGRVYLSAFAFMEVMRLSSVF